MTEQNSRGMYALTIITCFLLFLGSITGILIFKVAQEPEFSESSVSTNATSIKNVLGEETENNIQLYKVTKIVDGDTIKVNYNDKTETIRLLGIDTPETVDPRKEVQCYGVEASNKMKELLENKEISLELDLSQGLRDKYNRILAYVYRAKDNLFINLELIKLGYAYEYTYNLPYKYQKEFRKAETSAKASQLGLWNPNVCPQK